MIDNGSLDMKDAVGPTLTGTGFSLATVSPTLILQAVGVIVGVVGIIYTRMRVKESKRYNDLYEERLNWEKQSASNTELSSEKTTGQAKETASTSTEER